MYVTHVHTVNICVFIPQFWKALKCNSTVVTCPDICRGIPWGLIWLWITTLDSTVRSLLILQMGHADVTLQRVPNRDVRHCMLCVCGFFKLESNQSHTHGSVCCRLVTRPSVKRLEFIRDTESRRWSDLCVQTRVIWPSWRISPSKQRSCVAWEEGREQEACGMLERLYREAGGGKVLFCSCCRSLWI